MESHFLPVKKFLEEPYCTILGYPKATKRQLQSRIKELEKLGVTKIAFQGKMRIGTLDILGKGYVGIVILAKKRTKRIALKIRRLDSQREEMKNEAKMLRLANKMGVGPKLIGFSKNFILMELLEGENIRDFVNNITGRGTARKMKGVVRKVLEDCFRLDQAGLDHGELSSIGKHVIISEEKTTIIDFESSSVSRRVSNVTAATQGIYIGSGIAKKMRKIYKYPTKNVIINVLRHYKQKQSQESFDDLLKTLL